MSTSSKSAIIYQADISSKESSGHTPDSSARIGEGMFTNDNGNYISSDFTSTSRIIDNNPPENIMLNSKKLCVLRPELLAFLDFKSLSEDLLAQDLNTKLYQQRFTKRQMQLEQAVNSLNAASTLDPENYSIALSQYESSLAAVSSEIALLKIAFMFKTYAKLGPSFTSFIKHYQFDIEDYSSENISLDTIGSSFENYMKETMLWGGDPTVIEEKIQKGLDATLLMQLINDLSFTFAAASPYSALPGTSGTRRISDSSSYLAEDLRLNDSRICNIYEPKAYITTESTEIMLSQRSGLIRLSRDITASFQLGKISAALGDEDERLKNAIEKYVDTDYFSSSIKIPRTLFASVVGWDPFAAAVSDISKINSNKTKYYYVPDFESYTKGLVSNFFTVDRNSVLLSGDSDEYQSSEAIGDYKKHSGILGTDYTIPKKTYSGVNSLVEAAFSADGGLNLSAYEYQITKFQDNLEDFSYIFRQLFKVLDKVGDTKSTAPDCSSKTHPTSPLNLQANVIKIVNDRFLKNAPTYIGLEPESLSNVSSIDEFYKAWGILFMVKKPDIAKKILSKFLDDYFKGFLTFSEETSIQSYTDANGATSDIEYRENVKPGTTTSVDLRNSRGGLYNYLQGMELDIASDSSNWGQLQSSTVAAAGISDWTTFANGDVYLPLWQPTSPSSVFSGTAMSEKLKAGWTAFQGNSDLDISSESAGFDSDFQVNNEELASGFSQEVQSLYAIQQALCMWTKAGDTVYPTGIIGVSCGVIDAVMSALYNCLAPVMEIESASGGDPFFPSVDSTSPPYHTQYFNFAEGTDANPNGIVYPAGFGAFTGMKTSYWVPTLEAMRTSLLRSEDLTTFYSGQTLGKVIEGVIDAFIESFPEEGQYGIQFGGKLQQTSLGEAYQVPSSLIATRDNATALAIPSWSYENYSVTQGRLFTGEQAISKIGDNDYGTLGPAYTADASSTAMALAGLMNSAEFSSLGDTDNPGAATDWDNLIPLWSAANSTYVNINRGGWGCYMFATITDGAIGTELNNESNVSIQTSVSKKLSSAQDDAGEGQNTIFGNSSNSIILAEAMFLAVSDASPTATTATPSQLLSRISGLDDWGIIVDEYKNVFEGMATAVGEADWTDFLESEEAASEDIDAAALSEIVDVIEQLVEHVITQIETLVNPEYIPSSIWLMVNLSGLQDSTYDPIGELLDLSMDELQQEYDNDWIQVSTGEGNIRNDSKSQWIYDSAFGDGKLGVFLYQLVKKLVKLRAEDYRLGVGLDITKKYAERIADYAETAIDGLTTSDGDDPSALEILIEELTQTSPGINVLQNLTENQLILKSASLEKNQGDPNEGYISKSEILGDNTKDAIELMLRSSGLLGSEGKNMKCGILGITAGMSESIKSDIDDSEKYYGPFGSSLGTNSESIKPERSPLIGIKVTASIPDYPILNSVPKIYRFDTELFVLPGAFDDINWGSVNSFRDLVLNTNFTRMRFEVREGDPGSSEPIAKVDSTEIEVLSNLIDSDSKNSLLYDIYANTLSSYLLEKYYKIMVGLGLSEDAFSTAGTGLQIPINDYAVDFASALSSIYSDLESDLDISKIENLFMPIADIESLEFNSLTTNSENISAIKTYSDMIKEFSTEIASGEFTEVASTLFEGFTNAASSRLFSAEAMRDNVLSAKYFDRVLYILSDPDEFLIAGPTAISDREQQLSSLGQSSKSLEEKYLSLYTQTIETLEKNERITKVSVDLDRTGEPDESDGESIWYKITVRKDEGDMSFASFRYTFVKPSLAQISLGSNGWKSKNWGVYITADNSSSVMIDDSTELGLSYYNS